MFTINGETWYIEFVRASHPMLRRSDGTWTIGSCDDPHKTIYIYHGLKKYLLKKVLCHEITHAAMYSYNVNLSLEQEELLADLLSTYGEEIIEIANRVFAKLIGRYA